MHLPHTTAFDWSGFSLRPGSLAGSLRTGDPGECRIALLGLPDDTGVGLNKGRLGAAEGPAAFRAALARYGSRCDALTDLDVGAMGIFDAGDVAPAGDSIDDTHDRIEAAVAALLDANVFPVCVGGGHDCTLPCVTALARRARREDRNLAGINIDAHLDMREEAGSGMAFFRLLGGDIANAVVPAPFAVIGLGAFCNSQAHLDWARKHGTRLVPFDGNGSALRAAYEKIETEHFRDASNVFATFDLDVLDASIAPGVSAINPMGLSSATAAGICRALGRLPNIRYFDLMELNPRFDVDGRTARVAAHLFLSFLAGVAERGDRS